MNIKEIDARIKELRIKGLELTNLGNDVWEEKTRLRDEYKRLTGKEI